MEGSEYIGRPLVDQEGSGDKYEVSRGSGLEQCLPVGTLAVAGLRWPDVVGSSVSLLEHLSFVPRVTSQGCVLNRSLFLVGLQRE